MEKTVDLLKLHKPEEQLLTPDLVKAIIEILKPAIQGLLAAYGRECLYVVVLYPGSGQPLFSESVGAEIPPNKPYADVALNKARLAFRTSMNTGAVITQAAHKMRVGDVVYQGGVYYDGLVVASSGAQAALDEAVSSMIAAQLSAYCQMVVSEQQKAALAGGAYLLP